MKFNKKNTIIDIVILNFVHHMLGLFLLFYELDRVKKVAKVQLIEAIYWSVFKRLHYN